MHRPLQFINSNGYKSNTKERGSQSQDDHLHTWDKLVDRIRRRIAIVPAVDDTVKSLKDVGIELKDNKP